MTQDKVICGFQKWSIGIGDNGEVVIEFNYHPHYGSISLHDSSIEDLRNLGEMFIAAARKASSNKGT